jgi:hypothetical protein
MGSWFVSDEELVRPRRAENELGLAVQLATLPWLGFVPDDCQFLIA